MRFQTNPDITEWSFTTTVAVAVVNTLDPRNWGSDGTQQTSEADTPLEDTPKTTLGDPPDRGASDASAPAPVDADKYAQWVDDELIEDLGGTPTNDPSGPFINPSPGSSEGEV